MPGEFTATFAHKCDGSENPPCSPAELEFPPILNIHSAGRAGYVSSNGVDEDIILAQDCHTYRSTYPDDNTFPLPTESSGYDRGSFLRRRAIKNVSETLSSLFVHVIEPCSKDTGVACGIEKVERIPLKDEDDESAAVAITLKSGDVHTWLVRLTPRRGDFDASLPLSRVELKPVESVDGKWKLNGHFGMVSSQTKLAVGSLNNHYIDGTPLNDDASAGIIQGRLDGIVDDAFRVAGSSISIDGLPTGDFAADDIWVSVSLGSIAVAPPFQATRFKMMSQKCLRYLASPATQRVCITFTSNHLPTFVSTETIWIEEMRPHRYFSGPPERSFRIIFSTACVAAECNPSDDDKNTHGVLIEVISVLTGCAAFVVIIAAILRKRRLSPDNNKEPIINNVQLATFVSHTNEMYKHKP